MFWQTNKFGLRLQENLMILLQEKINELYKNHQLNLLQKICYLIEIIVLNSTTRLY